MALSAFADKSQPPLEEEVAAKVGDSFALWTSLKEAITAKFAPISEEWGFSGAKYGWGFRLKQKKRAVLYMTPQEGFFLASFALGEKAVKAAHDAGLPTQILDVIEAAPKYAEGRGVRLEVRSKDDLASILKLADIKMAN